MYWFKLVHLLAVQLSSQKYIEKFVVTKIILLKEINNFIWKVCITFTENLYNVFQVNLLNFVHQIIKNKIYQVFYKYIKQHLIITSNQHIRMISEDHVTLRTNEE